MRRAHGAEAALFAARASYVAGFQGTSNVLAGAEFNIPVFGTMAHSFVQAHDNEELAFEHFARAQPENGTLRIDSGDLAIHAHNVRRILDEAGLTEIGIFSSGSLDEYALRNLLSHGAPIDGFGVGTAMDTSADAPFLDCAYKLQEYAGRARRKRSEGKATWPGRKQVYRAFDASGVMTGDVLTLEPDPQPGEALIRPIMRNGKRAHAPETLEDIRRRAAEQLQRLPRRLRELEDAPPCPVSVAPALRELAVAVDRH